MEDKLGMMIQSPQKIKQGAGTEGLGARLSFGHSELQTEKSMLLITLASPLIASKLAMLKWSVFVEKWNESICMLNITLQIQ